MYNDNSGTTAGLVIVAILFYALIVAVYVVGIATMWIAINHSVKKRVVRGEDFSAGSSFGWYIGWGLATAYSLGIAPIVYYFSQRETIRATTRAHRELMAAVRDMAWQSSRYQQTATPAPTWGPVAQPYPLAPDPAMTATPGYPPAYPLALAAYSSAPDPYPTASQGFGPAPSAPPDYPSAPPTFYAPPPAQP